MAVLVVEVVQVALLVGDRRVGARLAGAAAGASCCLVVAAVLLGTLAFAGLGLLLAGTLRAETMLALANVLFLAYLVLGGIVVPIDQLPGAARRDRRARCRRAPLADALRVALGASPAPPDAAGSLALLGVWGVGAVVLAARTFRWE